MVNIGVESEFDAAILAYVRSAAATILANACPLTLTGRC